jgi:hypothetical protein
MTKEMSDEVERLREELRLTRAVAQYAQHDSWRCEYPPHYYLTTPTNGCPCGLDAALEALGELAQPETPSTRRTT